MHRAKNWQPKADTERGTTDSIRLSVTDAGGLQSFRRDYPWQGWRTKHYEQVGNAVPPLLAKSVAQALMAELNGYRERTEIRAAVG